MITSQETFSLPLSFSRFSRILSLCGNHAIGILKDKGINGVNIEGSVELVYNFARRKMKINYVKDSINYNYNANGRTVLRNGIGFNKKKKEKKKRNNTLKQIYNTGTQCQS